LLSGVLQVQRPIASEVDSLAYDRSVLFPALSIIIAQTAENTTERPLESGEFLPIRDPNVVKAEVFAAHIVELKGAVFGAEATFSAC
jgi:hypothetical protein